MGGREKQGSKLKGDSQDENPHEGSEPIVVPTKNGVKKAAVLTTRGNTGFFSGKDVPKSPSSKPALHPSHGVPSDLHLTIEGLSSRMSLGDLHVFLHQCQLGEVLLVAKVSVVVQ